MKFQKIVLSLRKTHVDVCLTSVTTHSDNTQRMLLYNPFLAYCRELAPSTVSLTGDRAQGDDSKHDLHYTRMKIGCIDCVFAVNIACITVKMCR